MTQQERLQNVRTILLRDWDALGVGDNPNLADEYDNYLPDILPLIESGCGFGELNGYLLRIERELGIELPHEKRVRAARALLQTTCQSGR